MDLNPRQFVAYRGLLVDTGRAPEDDEEILSKIRPTRRDNTLYGRHWTTDHGVARRFATNPTSGGYETQPTYARRFNSGDKYGVVLEAQAHGRALDLSEPYSAHEKEVRVHHPDFDHKAANHLQSLRAHVYETRTHASLAEEHPLVPGQRVASKRSELFRQGYREPVRSFDIPRSHWDT